MRRFTLNTLVAGLAVLIPASAGAEILYATDGAAISRFDSTAPAVAITAPVTGLQAGETLVGIDVRPGTATLYGVGNSNQIYTVNPVTGAATPVGAAGTFTLNGAKFGMDFRPNTLTFDRIRLVSDAEQNLRLNPDTGALANTDTALNPAGNVVAIAYNRNYLRLAADSTPTTLFGIDSSGGTLVTIGGFNGDPSANLGAITTVGSLGLGVNLSPEIGFDISGLTANGAPASPTNLPIGTAYASITRSGISRLYDINLTTGSVTLRQSDPLGIIGTGTAYHGLAAAGARLLPGDANLDGIVGPEDFNLLATNFGLLSGGDWRRGDFNKDGIVGPGDFNLLATNFGKSGFTNVVGAAAALPEPASAGLLGCGALCLLLGRRRRAAAPTASPAVPSRIGGSPVGRSKLDVGRSTLDVRLQNSRPSR